MRGGKGKRKAADSALDDEDEEAEEGVGSADWPEQQEEEGNEEDEAEEDEDEADDSLLKKMPSPPRGRVPSRSPGLSPEPMSPVPSQLSVQLPSWSKL